MLTISGATTARSFRWSTVALIVIAATALTLRLSLSLRSGLWVDEVFSLAMATGHSIEQAPAAAQRDLGDFAVPASAQRASVFASYATHDRAATGIDRVLRAVLLSDTSPPLYYTSLWLWTRAAGTSDAVLRLFSMVCALACVPLIWTVARKVHGDAAGAVAAAAFAVSPLALYYSAEGRMYALTWLFGLALANLTLDIQRASSDTWGRGAAWTIAAAGGLLTHYFFAFVWAACAAWLLACCSAQRRIRIIGLVGASVLVVLPWYIRVPASLSTWRVTQGWLDGSLRPSELVVAAARLTHGLLFWGGSYRSLYVTGAISLVLAILVVRSMRTHRAPAVMLMWAWGAASIAGLLLFDEWRGTRSSDYLRYALPALPAALVLLAIVITTAPRRTQVVLTGAIAVMWCQALLISVFTAAPRPFQPLPDVAGRLQAWNESGRTRPLLIVHTIPTGLIGLTRYLDDRFDVFPSIIRINNAASTADIERVTAGYERFAYVRFHDFDVASAYEAWLSQHAAATGTEQLAGVHIQYFTRAPFTAAER